MARGNVIKLEAKVVDPYSDKIVVGTMVTVRTEKMVESKLKDIDSVVFYESNSLLPEMGAKVGITVEVFDE